MRDVGAGSMDSESVFDSENIARMNHRGRKKEEGYDGRLGNPGEIPVAYGTAHPYPVVCKGKNL